MKIRDMISNVELLDDIQSCDIDSFIGYLESIKQNNPEYSKIWFDVVADYDYTEVNCWGEREETEEETKQRLKENEKIKQEYDKRQMKLLEKEKEEYERLKRKFG